MNKYRVCMLEDHRTFETEADHVQLTDSGAAVFYKDTGIGSAREMVCMFSSREWSRVETIHE